MRRRASECWLAAGVWDFARRGSGRAWRGIYSGAAGGGQCGGTRRGEAGSVGRLRRCVHGAPAARAPGGHSQHSAAARRPLPPAAPADGWAPGPGGRGRSGLALRWRRARARDVEMRKSSREPAPRRALAAVGTREVRTTSPAGRERR